MNPLRFIALISILLIISILTAPVFIQAEADKMRFIIGYSSKSLPEVDIKDAAAALDVWVKEIAKDLGISASSNIYSDLNALKRDFQNGKIDMGVTLSIDYINIEQELQSELALVSVKNDKVTTKYLLLVHSDSEYSRISDLKNKKIAMLKGNDLGMVFVNYCLLRENLPDANKFFQEIQEKNKPSQVTLAVFFKQADACITTETSFKNMIDLNPQIGKMVKVIATSPELIESVSFFRKDYEETSKQRLLEKTRTLEEYPRGRQILLLFKVEKLEIVKNTALDKTRKYYKDFKRLAERKRKHANSIKGYGEKL